MTCDIRKANRLLSLLLLLICICCLCYSFHPYIFFNQDHESVTFLCFNITPDGNLVNPKTKTIMEGQLLTKELQNRLVMQRIDFNEDYSTWDRYS